MNEYHAALTALTAFPSELGTLVAGISDDDAQRMPAPNEWSVVEIIGHLIDIDPLQIDRIDRMLAEERPHFVRFDPDAAVTAAGYGRRALTDVLAAFTDVRRATVDGLSTIAPDELSRVGVRYTGQEVTLGQLLTAFAAHDQTHAQQIRAILAPKG